MHKELRGIFLYLIYTFSVLLPYGALLAKSQSDEKTASRNFFELRANWHQENPLESYKLHRKNQPVPTTIASGHTFGRFNAMDVWAGNRNQPITLNKYLYANANPVSMVDPSGYFSMADVMSTMRISFSLATKVGNVVFRIQKVADAVTFAADLFQILGASRLNAVRQGFTNLAAGAASDASFKKVLGGDFFKEASMNLWANMGTIFGKLLINANSQRGQKALEAAASPRAALFLFMPTPPKGPTPNPQFIVKTGVRLKFGKAKRPLYLYFGHGGYRGRYTGFGVASSRTVKSEVNRPFQFFRQDYHEPFTATHEAKDLEDAYWESGDFHYHVLSKR